MKTETLIKAVEEIAPRERQEPWDNSGPQILLERGEVQRVLVCLEITKEVIEEAKEAGADFIITHHPLIFDPLQSIDDKTMTGGFVAWLINLGISVYSCHTPFDKVDGGNNDYLADLLGLRDISGFSAEGDLEMIGRVGQLAEARTLYQVVAMVEEKLDLGTGQARAVGDRSTLIKTIGICAGAGADFMEAAAADGCQLFLTGDIKYHDAQKARAIGICLIDAGHYGTEKSFAGNFSQQLREKTKGRVEVIASEAVVDPFGGV